MFKRLKKFIAGLMAATMVVTLMPSPAMLVKADVGSNAVTPYSLSERMVKVAVYATNGSTLLSSDMEDYLGIHKKNSLKYYPVGAIELPASFFSGSSPYIRTEADFNKVMSAVSNIDTTVLTGEYKTQNGANTIGQHLDVVQMDLNAPGSQFKTALIKASGTEGMTLQGAEYHLDLRFSGNTIKFTSVKELVDGSFTKGKAGDLGNREYLTGTKTIQPGTTSADWYLGDIGSEYSIEGYYTNSNCKNKYTFGNVLNADTEVYVKLIRQTISITYDLGDGNTQVFDNVKVGATTPTVIPTRTGYEFDGWMDDKGNYYENNEALPNQVTTSTTYTARWKNAKVKVAVYATDGSKTGRNEDLERILGLSFKQADGYYPIGVIEVPTDLLQYNNGNGPFINELKDWQTVAAAIGDVSTDELISNGRANAGNKIRSNLSFVQPDYGYGPGQWKTAMFTWSTFSDNISGDYLYHLDIRFATHMLNIYEVKQNTNGNYSTGNNPIQKVPYLKDQITVEPTVTVPEEFDFGGYYSDSACTIPYEFETAISSDKDVYVKLDRKKYNVKYELAGGISTSTQYTFENVLFGASTPTIDKPTKTNYTLSGWKDDSNNTYAVNAIPAKVTKSVTYTALWTEKDKIVINYIPSNGGSVNRTTESVNPDDGIPQGSTATPDDNHYFEGWKDKDGNIVSTDPTITPDKPDENTEYIASFVKRNIVTITADSNPDAKYNGSNQTVSTFTTDLPEGYTITGVTTTGAGKNVGDYTIGIKVNADYQIKDASGIDVTDRYKVNTKTGSLKISKREVTLTSATPKAKEYDGKPLTDNNVIVSEDGFVKGEEPAYTVTGSRTLVGTSKNTFTYAFANDGIAKNYTVTKVEGELTVTDRDEKFVITVEANSSTDNTYDGIAKSVSGLITTEFTVNGEQYTVSGLNASRRETNAGTYEVEITGTATVRDEAGNTVTNQFDVQKTAGTLQIAPKSVTLTVADASKTFGATDPTFTGATNDGTKLVGVEYSRTNMDEKVGTYTAVLTATVPAERNPNYAVTVVNGTFTISQSDTLTVTHGDVKEEYNRKPHGGAALSNDLRGTTFEYSTDNGANWSTTIPTLTEVGTTDVKVRAKNSNYSNVPETSYTISVTPKAVTIEVTNANKIYGNADPSTFTGKVSGVVSGDNLNVTYSREEGEAVGEYAITANYNTENNNYSVTVTPGIFTITPKSGMAISVNNAQKTYDGTPLSTTATVRGVDEASAEKTVISYSVDNGTSWTTEAPSITNVSESKTVLVKAENPNYTGINPVSYTLTVTPATMTISVEDVTGVYSGQPYGSTAVVKGAPDGTTLTYAEVVNRVANNYVDTKIERTNAGITAVSVKAENANYQTAYTTYNVVVSPKEVTLSATESSKTFGENDPVFTFTGDDALVNGNDLGSITVSRTNNAQGVGIYENVLVVTYSNRENANYIVTTMPANFEIKKASALDLSVPADHEYTYNGNRQGGDLVSFSQTDNTNITYSVDNGQTWTNRVPTVTDVSEVTVKVKAENPNYKDVIKEYKITVKPFEVTVKAEDKTKVYRENDPELTYAIGDMVNGEAKSLITVSGISRDDGENVGDYVITATGSEIQGNYKVTFRSGKFTIIKADGLILTVPEDAEYEYSGNPQGGELTSSADKDNTTFTYSTNGGVTWQDTVPTVTNVGEITVTVKAENPNYNDVVDKYTITVTPKPVTVKANDITNVKYGDAVPELTATVTGLVSESDTITYTISRETGDEASTYTITPSGNTVQGNYAVTYETGTLTIDPVDSLVITTTNYEGVYDGASHGVAATVSGTKNDNDSILVEYKIGDAAWTTEAPTVTNYTNGKVTVEVRATNANYVTKVTTYTLEVKKASVKIKVANDAKVYGKADPTFATPEVSGLVNENDLGAIRVVREDASTNVDVGIYEKTLDATYTANDNYEVVVEKGDFEITQADASELKLVVTNYEGTYDGIAHGSAATTDVKAGTTIEYKVGNEDWTTEVPTVTDVTNGPITVQVRATNNNFSTPAEKTYTLQVNPKTVNVTANNKSKNYGEADPTLDAFVDGTLGEDTVSYTITREDGSAVGTYAIKPAGDATQGNYSVSYSNGTLTITAKNITIPEGGQSDISAEKMNDVTYNGQSQMPEPVVKDGQTTLAKDTDYTLSYSDDTTNVGTVTVTITGKGNYEGTQTVTYQITPAAVTVTADNKEKVFGQADPELTATVTGTFNNETVAYTLAREDGEAVVANGYPITVTADKDQGNYTVTVAPGTLTIKPKSIADPEKPQQPENPENPEDPENPGTPENPEEPVIVPIYPEGYEGVRVSEPEDVTYDGTEQKQEIVVTDKDGNKLVERTDYEVTYSEDTTNAGTVTVTITGINNYEGTVIRTYDIEKRVVSFTSPSAGKIYDGTALTATTIAVGIQGFPTGEGATFTVLGSQTAVGSSANLFNYELNQGTNPDNYDIRVVVGTLTVAPAPAADDPTPASVLHTLTIHYVDAAGNAVAPDYVGSFVTGSAYLVASPVVMGYTPAFASVASPAGGMPDMDIEISVLYTANTPVVPQDGNTPADTTPNTPNGLGNGGDGTPAINVDANAPVENIAIPDANVPQGALSVDEDGNVEIVEIEDEDTALAGNSAKAWALINLLAMIATAVLGIILLVLALKKKEEDEEEEDENTVKAESEEDEEDEEDKEKNKKVLKLCGLIPAIASVIVFILTENMRNPMAYTDKWTVLMIILLVVEIVLAILSKKKKDDEEDENEEQTPAEA